MSERDDKNLIVLAPAAIRRIVGRPGAVGESRGARLALLASSAIAYGEDPTCAGIRYRLQKGLESCSICVFRLFVNGRLAKRKYITIKGISGWH